MPLVPLSLAQPPVGKPPMRRAQRVLGAVGVIVVIGLVIGGGFVYRAALPAKRPDVQVLPTSDQRVDGDLRGVAVGRNRLIMGQTGTLRFGFLVKNLQPGALRVRAKPAWAGALARRGILVTVGWSPPRREVQSFDVSLGPLVPQASYGFIVATYRITCAKASETIDLTPRLELGLDEAEYRDATRSAPGTAGKPEDAKAVPLAVSQIVRLQLRRRSC